MTSHLRYRIGSESWSRLECSSVQEIRNQSRNLEPIQELRSNDRLGKFTLLLVLAYVHNQSVVRVQIGDGTISESYVVGTTRTPGCSCPVTQGDSACIQHIGLDPSLLPSCWRESEIRSKSFVLLVLYVLLMAGVGALVGLGVMVRAQRKKRAKA